jgi:Tol biopolymer transport system component
MTRRDALARLAGLAAVASAATSRGEDEGAERPPARIYVTVPGRRGEAPPEVAGVLAVDPKDGTWVRVASAEYSIPRVSPDGRKVLCTRQRLANGQPLGLHVCDARGDDPPRKIADGPLRHYSWSPDGMRIFCVERRDDGGSRTFRMNADGNGRDELPIPATETIVACSRDGRWFATLSARGAEGPLSTKLEVNLMHPDGSGVRRLLDAGESRVVLGFSPDGRDLLFTRYDRDENGIIRSARLEMIGVDGKDWRIFLKPRGKAYPIQAAWSPDGKEIAVNDYEDDGKAGERRTLDTKITTRIEIVSADGQRSRRLDVLDGIPFGLWDWR